MTDAQQLLQLIIYAGVAFSSLVRVGDGQSRS